MTTEDMLRILTDLGWKIAEITDTHNILTNDLKKDKKIELPKGYKKLPPALYDYIVKIAR